MATKPQIVEGLLKATIEAIALINDPANKEMVTRLLASNLRLTNQADIEEMYQAVIANYERAPHTSVEGMKRLQKLLTQQNPKIAEVRVETLIDAAPMNKLESSGFIQSLYKK
jgi:ABC-type nitrate/sulfonate/bicarbonate transport system substrate-binding protein